MARATFEGPVISGDVRFGPLRNIGYSQLVQNVDLDTSNSTVGSSTYAGGSGQFVASNSVPNVNAVVYTPSSTAYPSVAQTIPADSATNVYRGAVFYLPTGADLDDIFFDIATAFSVTGGSAVLTSVQFLASNNYTAAAGTAAYFATGVLTSNAVGRQSLSTFTGTQINNQSSTSTDILQAGQPNLSQVVVTIALVGTALDTRTSLAGKVNVTLRYTQPDNNIGTLTTYPYGNFD
jgi:hypothetical protein